MAKNTEKESTYQTINTDPVIPEKVKGEVVSGDTGKPKTMSRLDRLKLHEQGLQLAINEGEIAIRRFDSMARKLAYHLWYIEKEVLYNAGDITYKGIGDYAEQRFGLRKSTVSEAINTFKRFGDPDAKDIKEQYRGYRWSALIAMKGMSDVEIAGSGITSEDNRETVKEKYKEYKTELKAVTDKRGETLKRWNNYCNEYKDNKEIISAFTKALNDTFNTIDIKIMEMSSDDLDKLNLIMDKVFTKEEESKEEESKEEESKEEESKEEESKEEESKEEESKEDESKDEESNEDIHYEYFKYEVDKNKEAGQGLYNVIRTIAQTLSDLTDTDPDTTVTAHIEVSGLSAKAFTFMSKAEFKSLKQFLGKIN